MAFALEGEDLRIAAPVEGCTWVRGGKAELIIKIIYKHIYLVFSKNTWTFNSLFIGVVPGQSAVSVS